MYFKYVFQFYLYFNYFTTLVRRDRAWFSRLYDIRPRNGAGLFFQPRSPHRTADTEARDKRPPRAILLQAPDACYRELPVVTGSSLVSREAKTDQRQKEAVPLGMKIPKKFRSLWRPSAGYQNRRTHERSLCSYAALETNTETRI